MKVLNEYPNHYYMEEYEKCGYFCPNCGKEEVWEDKGSGDYYMGVDYICVACGKAFYLPSGTWSLREANEIAKLVQLRSGITGVPKAKLGN